MRKEIVFEEDEYYLVFVLGYDLLHDKLEQCEERACDYVFDTLKDIVKLFLDSAECKDFTLSTYDALGWFIDNNEIEIDRILFNNLDYKGKKFGE